MRFCSRAAVDSHEPPAGTGVRAEAYLFLPVPKRFWRESELNRAWASRAELEAIRAGRQAGVVTRLYNPAPGWEAHALVYAAPDAPPSPGLAPVLSALAGRWPVEDRARPRLAICTHGTRDRCCAKWGFAVYSEARRLFEAGLSAFEPMESSHLGGDRFAATGIFFPSGDMYAHLDRIDLAALAAAEAAGTLSPEHYRGRVFDPPLVQVVRAGLAREGLLAAAAEPLTAEPAERAGASLEVRARAGERRFTVSLETTPVTFFSNCDDAETGRTSAGRRNVFVAAREG